MFIVYKKYVIIIINIEFVEYKNKIYINIWIYVRYWYVNNLSEKYLNFFW